MLVITELVRRMKKSFHPSSRIHLPLQLFLFALSLASTTVRDIVWKILEISDMVYMQDNAFDIVFGVLKHLCHEF